MRHGRQRVSQLVTEHSEKLIPSLIFAGEFVCTDLERLFDGLALGEVFDVEEDVRREVATAHPTRMDAHDASTELFEVVADLVISDLGLFGKDLLENLTQAWDVPLPVAEIV